MARNDVGGDRRSAAGLSFEIDGCPQLVSVQQQGRSIDIKVRLPTDVVVEDATDPGVGLADILAAAAVLSSYVLTPYALSAFDRAAGKYR